MKFLQLLAAVANLGVFSSPLFAWQGIGARDIPKYAEGFKHYDYANPDAPKGGRIVFGFEGGFDTLNPYSTKGIAPLILDRLVFENLGENSLEQPNVKYPSLAENFVIAKDNLSMTVTLPEQAQFADGSKVTAEDVVFSFNLFRSDSVAPFFKTYWSDIKELKIINARTVRMIFAQYNPELASIATELPILPKKFYGTGNFAKDFDSKVLGSGPYVVDSFERDSYIRFKRNPKYWAKDLPVNKGRFNFDEILIKYYKDATAMVEAFKKGDFDFFPVRIAKIWSKDLDGEKFDLNWISKEQWPHQNNQGAQGFFFNLRKKIFQDQRVRKAIALTFDFPWTNKTVFYGLYDANASFFENSPLAAKGPIPDEEKKILLPLSREFAGQIPEDVFTEPMQPVGTGMNTTQRMQAAIKLLGEAGYSHQGDSMCNKEGDCLKFTFLNHDSAFGRAIEPFIKNLARIGMLAKMEINENAIYQQKVQKRDFDVIGLAIGETMSPGNEQTAYWGSKSADEPMSRNHYGLKNKAVDALIPKIIYAKTTEELTLYVRCLDRLLFHLHIGVHHWHSKTHRIALWNKFGKPKTFPPFYEPLSFYEYMWVDQQKSDALSKALESKTKLLIKD